MSVLKLDRSPQGFFVLLSQLVVDVAQRDFIGVCIICCLPIAFFFDLKHLGGSIVSAQRSG
jgi:hypothetical protein